MILTENQKKDILSNFPNIKLSYGNILHNKVCNADIMFAIPEGNKCFIWFTKYKETNVYFIVELFKNKFIKDVKLVNDFLKNEIHSTINLSFGTILYGTLFNNNNNIFFTTEDIFFYKDLNVKNNNWFEKYVLLKKILSYEIKQTFVIFGLPVLSNNISNLIDKIKALKYKIHVIQFKNFNKCNHFLYVHYQNITKLSNKHQYDAPETYKLEYKLDNYKTNNFNVNKKKINIFNIFNVIPDVQNDIYYLKCYNSKQELIFYDTAHIPDFKTSIFMNKLFRNIKENDNLDTLEESDDEKEFENNSPNKFVNLDKSYNIMCSFCNKFKKWIPIKLADNNASIVNVKYLQTK